MNKLNVVFLLGTLWLGVFSANMALAQVTVEDGGTYIENQVLDKQDAESKDPLLMLYDTLVEEGIAISASILAMGLSSLFYWLKKKGIEITPEQEKLFITMVTERYKKLAKNSWKKMRDDPDKYWSSLKNGKIPDELVTDLKKEGKDFATDLLKKEQFKDFAKTNVTNKIDGILEDVRTELKEDYQKRMLNVLPKIAGIAVEAAYEPGVMDVKTWSEKALTKIRPLLFSTEAIDKEENIRIILESEVKKRLMEFQK